MTGRVEEDPERRPGLVLVLGGTQRDDRRLGLVEVVDVDIEVHLLGDLDVGDRVRELVAGEAVDERPGERVAVAVGGPKANKWVDPLPYLLRS